MRSDRSYKNINRRLLLSGSASGALVIGVAGAAFLSHDTSAQTSATDTALPKLPIGINLAGITDYENGFPFKNLMWGARLWLTRNFSGEGPFNTETQAAFQFDADGYPLEVPVKAPRFVEPQTVFTVIPNRLKPGKFVLLYDGDGEFEALGATRIVKAAPGRLELTMLHDHKKNIEVIVIKRSKRGDHVRNIRILAAAYEKDDLNANPFLPEFLEFCRPFHCLRFMDWTLTNNSIEEEWSSRKRRSFYTMAGMSGDFDGIYNGGKGFSAFEKIFSGGVAHEVVINLCNRLNINPWVCIPHRASDDYIAQMASLYRRTLNRNLKVYLEYSNELWNWQFFQAQWMIRSKLAGSLVEAKGGFPWEDPGRTKGKDHPERIGALFRRAFAIWEKEWSGTDRARLIRIGAVQAAWPDTAKRVLNWCLEDGGVDTVSPAAYFGPDDIIYNDWESLGARLSPEKVIADMRTIIDAERLRPVKDRIPGLMTETVKFGRGKGLLFAAYEAGQHIQPKGQAELPYNPALAAAQVHPGMYSVYVEWLRVQRDLGCELFMHFSSVGEQGTRYGSWGAKARYDTPDIRSPKMRALQTCNLPKS